MWWKLRKIEETEKTVVYEYCHKNPPLFDGLVEIDKEKRVAECLRLPEGDSDPHFLLFMEHAWYILVKENYPDERMIAIG